jgi:ABC-type transport system involved in multi-copper enzyme maturation permease subunit
VSVRTIVALVQHAWTRHRVPLIPIAAAIGLFQFILTRMAPAPNEVGWLSGLLAAFPPELRALIGNEVALSPGGFLAIGYGHPFFILLMSAWVVRTSSAGVAGEVGLGTMDLVASRPVPRWHFVAAGLTTIVLGLAIIVACAWIGTAIGLALRPADVRATAFAKVIAGAWLLFAAFGGVGLLIGATRRDGGQAIAWTTAILAASFVLDYLARLWTPIARLRPLSLFRYYAPQAILASGLPFTSLIVLGTTLILSLTGSIIIVTRRDL